MVLDGEFQGKTVKFIYYSNNYIRLCPGSIVPSLASGSITSLVSITFVLVGTLIRYVQEQKLHKTHKQINWSPFYQSLAVSTLLFSAAWLPGYLSGPTHLNYLPTNYTTSVAGGVFISLGAIIYVSFLGRVLGKIGFNSTNTN